MAAAVRKGMDRPGLTQPPKVAVYGEHAHRGPSAATRSRLQLLRQQNKAPSGRWTASSFHPPSSDLQADGGGHPAPTPARGAVDPHSAAAEYASYVNNLREQVGVLEAEVGMYKQQGGSVGDGSSLPRVNHAQVRKLPSSGAGGTRAGGASTTAARSGFPAVEVHNTNLMEHLQQENHKVSEMSRQHASKTTEEQELLKEVHRLRQLAATERNAAATAARDKEEALEQKRRLENRATTTEDNLQALQGRFDFVLEELNFVKAELDAARANAEKRYVAPSSASAKDLDVAMENESLKAEVAELREWLKQRDTIIDELQGAQTASAKEHSTVMNNLRHEQQRYQLLLTSNESLKVRLHDADSEVQYLRSANAALQDDVKRLTRQTDELFSKIKTEMEQRQIKDAQVSNTIECSRALQGETAKVHAALLAEQGLNSQLREELEATKRQLDEANRRNKAVREQYEELQRSLGDVQERYNARAAELEGHIGRWKHLQTRQLTCERQQIERAHHLIEEMRGDAAQLLQDRQKVTEKLQEKIPSDSCSTATALVQTTERYTPSEVEGGLYGRERSPEVMQMEQDVRSALAKDRAARSVADDVLQLARQALAAVRQDIPPPPPNPPC